MNKTSQTLPDHSPRPKSLVFVSPWVVDIAAPAWFHLAGRARPHRVFTIFHVFILAGIGAGLALGMDVGLQLFGVCGGVVGAMLGGGAGYAAGRLPEDFVLQSLARELALASADELRAYLHGPECQTPNVVLLELQSRGEDIQPELPWILDMLVSEKLSRRGLGWAALTSAFPVRAGQLGDYRTDDSVAECRRKTAKLRNAAALK
jgi:hypothetical protein